MSARPSEEQLSLEFRPKRRREQMTLRFKRTISFPRFGMETGETWMCDRLGGTGRAYTAAIASGSDRFAFAGGQCLVIDVEVVA